MCGVGAVDWCGFTWEAFATLSTGLAAVSAAVYIGRKQSEIQNKLVEVQQVEAGLQVNALKAKNFDRRFQNYTIVRDFLIEVLRSSGEPERQSIDKFLDAHRETRFLFEPEVYNGLQVIWNDCMELFGIDDEINQLMVSDGHAGVDLPRRKHDQYTRVSASYRSLHEVYHQLNLHI